MQWRDLQPNPELPAAIAAPEQLLWYPAVLQATSSASSAEGNVYLLHTPFSPRVSEQPCIRATCFCTSSRACPEKRPPIHPLPAQEHHLLPASSIPSQLSATWWTAQTTKQQKNRHFLGAGLAPAVASNGAHRNALQHVCDTQWPPLQMRSRAS